MQFDEPFTPGLISVVLPSRKRLDGLKRAWASASLLCHAGVELLVAYDADDEETRVCAEDIGARRCIVFPERLYWDGNNTYFSALFRASRGEWIMPYGDDGEMLTDGWGFIVHYAKPGVLYLMGGVAGHNVFPIVHRSVLEALPWDVCPSPHQDTWLTDVARGAGLLHEVGVHIREHRVLDETRPQERFRYRTEEYYSSEMEALRQRDIAILKEKLT